MKYLILIICSLMSWHTFACQLSIPGSYIPTFLAPPVSGAYQTCEEKPEDKCHCVDTVDPWTSEFIDGEFKESGDKITLKLNRENAIKAKIEAKKAAKQALKDIDIEGATTVSKLKAIVKMLLEAQEFP